MSSTLDSGLRTHYARDRDYWNRYYSSSSEALSEPSSFALSIAHILERNRSILDVGCGNGRDSIFFLNAGLKVVGIDASDVAIERLHDISSGNDDAEFICGDFVNDRRIYTRKFDYIYSRFTLHAISSSQQNELLSNILRALKPGGKFFVEARTLRDDLYGKGESLGDNAFIYNDHYRRFIDPEELAEIMRNMGYKIISLVERKGFSKFGESDPPLMRMTAEV